MKKIGSVLLSAIIASSLMAGCQKNTSDGKSVKSTKKFAKADMDERTKKLDKTFANLKNQKDIMTTGKATLMTTDYEDITGIEAVAVDGKDFTQSDLSGKDMTIAYVWYTS